MLQAQKNLFLGNEQYFFHYLPLKTINVNNKFNNDVPTFYQQIFEIIFFLYKQNKYFYSQIDRVELIVSERTSFSKGKGERSR